LTWLGVDVSVLIQRMAFNHLSRRLICSRTNERGWAVWLS
jgi:hypothetical protein